MAINVNAVTTALPSELPFEPIATTLGSTRRGTTLGSTRSGTGRPAATPGEGSFAGRLTEAVREVNEMQKSAETLSNDYAAGRQNDIHGVMVATTQADISLRLLANVRNRIIDAYREVMRMGA